MSEGAGVRLRHGAHEVRDLTGRLLPVDLAIFRLTPPEIRGRCLVLRRARRGAAQDPNRELPYSGFFLIKDGKVTLLGGDKDTPGAAPNGITLSPDERYLYVTAGGRRTMRYEIQPDDTIANGKLFVDDGTDGMRVDTKGNLYTTSGGTPGRIQITSPEGKPLGRLYLPQPDGEPKARVCATNMAFGDADDRGLYITACTHLLKLRTKVVGVRPGRRY